MNRRLRALVVVLAAVLALLLNGAAAGHASTASETSSAHRTATVAVPPVYAPPEEDCIDTIEGTTVTKTYPDGVTIEWECFCEWMINSQGKNVHPCGWIPTDPKKNNDQQYWTDVNSGLEIDVAGPSLNNGAVVHQWSFTGVSNQLWTTYKVDDTSYELVNLYSGKCMGVGGASTGSGAQVVQWACNGSTDQHWIFQDTFNSIGGWPVYEIVNVNAQKCLGIGGGSTSIGANAVIWPCDGSQNQLFY